MYIQQQKNSATERYCLVGVCWKERRERET